MTPLSVFCFTYYQLDPAVFLEATDSLGVVAPGKLADLVLLNGNPLVEISATQEIEAVFLNGRVFSRSELDQMLAEAKSWAASQTYESQPDDQS